MTEEQEAFHSQVTLALNELIHKLYPEEPFNHFLYLSNAWRYIFTVSFHDTINDCPYDCVSRAYSNEPEKVFYLKAYNNRRKIVQYLVNTLGMEYLEKDYRKQYLLLKTKDTKALYTLLKILN